MNEDDVPVAAIAAAGAAARALMRMDASAEKAVVDALAATAIRTAERFCGRVLVDEGWEGVPSPVRHGVAMLIQHLFEDREGARMPPAAVAALWRPYRVVRLS
jgi:hypothetical protein